jgi:hypothetical protein
MKHDFGENNHISAFFYEIINQEVTKALLDIPNRFQENNHAMRKSL